MKQFDPNLSLILFLYVPTKNENLQPLYRTYIASGRKYWSNSNTCQSSKLWVSFLCLSHDLWIERLASSGICTRSNLPQANSFQFHMPLSGFLSGICAINLHFYGNPQHIHTQASRRLLRERDFMAFELRSVTTYSTWTYILCDIMFHTKIMSKKFRGKIEAAAGLRVLWHKKSFLRRFESSRWVHWKS